MQVMIWVHDVSMNDRKTSEELRKLVDGNIATVPNETIRTLNS